MHLLLKILAASLVFVFADTAFAFAQKGHTYKTDYRQVSRQTTFRLMDTFPEPIALPEGGIELPLGDFLYTAYYRDGLSRTEIRFVPAKGIHASNEDVGYLFSRAKDSAFFFYVNDSLADSYVFSLPVLIETAQSKTINGYTCTAYLYKQGKELTDVVWCCKKLSAWVSPGLYVKGLGGIVQIDHLRSEGDWSLQLVSFGETNEKIDFEEKLPKPKGKSRLNYFLKKEQ